MDKSRQHQQTWTVLGMTRNTVKTILLVSCVLVTVSYARWLVVFIIISSVTFLYAHPYPVLIRGLYMRKPIQQQWFLGE
jgi:hypothetical protein